MYITMLSCFIGVVVAATLTAAFVEGNVVGGDAAPRFEPQVAIVCATRSQYLAQYMTESGRWVTDPSNKVTCLKDKADILRFCRQVYPKRDITNFVESSHYYKVPNFCRIGRNKCKASLWVKPYRCLEGSFQSDALLVPEGCLFDHIHNQSRCWDFDRWNTTAEQACQGRSMMLKSFAMLLPCGVDVFSGVEFVCCPKNNKSTNKIRNRDIEEPLALPQVDQRLHSSNHVSEGLSAAQDVTTPAQEIGTRDEYFSRFDPHEEHDAFRKAEQRLEEKHRQKVAKIMKEWSELEERYQILHEKDPKGAEEFRHHMTQRFQQTVEAVEAENEAEKHQLTALHQQRIVAHINEMKREAMTCFTRALAESRPNTHRVQKCLQKLLRALNKDRHHTVSHYKHLLNTDYEAADRERDSTLQHLTDLEKMVNQSLSMLERHPDLYAKIGHLMHEYAVALRSKDTTPPELVQQSLKNVEKDVDDKSDYNEKENATEDENSEERSKIEEPESDDDDGDYEDDTVAEDVLSEHKTSGISEVSSHIEVGTIPFPAESVPSIDPLPSTLAAPSSSVATEHKLEEPQVAHAQHHPISHSQSSYSVTREVSPSESRGVYFTLAFAGIGLMAAMVVGIFVLRQRNNKNPQNQGFIEVDQSITPEEKHVVNMQVNGYENPTYKYFEEK